VTVRLRCREEYLGHAIELSAVPSPSANFPGLAAVATIKDATGRQICRFRELLDSMLQGGANAWPEDDEQAAKQLMERAFHRARAAILLGRAGDLDNAKFYVPETVTYAPRSPEYIRGLVLRAFDNVVRLSLQSHPREPFDDIGICLLEELNPNELEYALARLRRDALIEEWAIGDKPGNRTLRATAEGLAEADRVSAETRAPDLLLEETVAQVERTLSKHKPILVEKLREQSLRVAEARELSDHDVGEIAQSCQQIIQDYLDLDVLWEGVDQERPPKGNTRDRLRTILKARSPSDTEQDLLQALESYLDGWFGKLEQFVHKYRHPPPESDRRHAKRCIIYTYLLLADLTELLGL